MPFSISFRHEPDVIDEELRLAHGDLIIGTFHEDLYANLFELSRADYEALWKLAMETVLSGQKAALIVYYVSPEHSSNMEWWPMYPDGDIVYLQNQMPWHDRFPEPFSLDAPFALLHNRRTISEDTGDKISEWVINRSEIEAFLRAFPASPSRPGEAS